MPRNHNPSFRPRLERLEDREVPAVTAVLNGGILLLQGTPQADFVRITVTNNLLLVNQIGIPPLRVFNRANVGEILFFGGGGNDVFINDSFVRAVAVGGTGNDLLVSLASQSQMVGGPGNDLIIGARGVQIFGGAGVNQIFQTTGLNPSTVFTDPNAGGITAAELALLSQSANIGFSNAFALLNPVNSSARAFTPLNPLNVQFPSFNADFNIFTPGFPTFNTGFNAISQGLTTVNTGFNPITQGLTTVNTGFNAITPGFTTLNTGFNTFTPFTPVTTTSGFFFNRMLF
jgi:hypothetical protein